jgi:hypothetical protein
MTAHTSGTRIGAEPLAVPAKAFAAESEHVQPRHREVRLEEHVSRGLLMGQLATRRSTLSK